MIACFPESLLDLQQLEEREKQQNNIHTQHTHGHTTDIYNHGGYCTRLRAATTDPMENVSNALYLLSKRFKIIRNDWVS